MANTDPINPELDDVLLQAIRGQLARVHVGFAAAVISYDSAKQTVSVQPIVRGRRVIDGVAESYRLPVLSGVPVEWPQGTGYSITWPLVAGDVGLVRIMERSHDEWKAEAGTDTIPQHPRRFDLSDATFYPGGASPADPLPASALDGAAMVLASTGASSLKLGSSSASHALAWGDLVQKVARALIDLLQTAGPLGNLGVPVLFSSDTVANSALYPATIGIPALSAAIDADTAFTSSKVKTE